MRTSPVRLALLLAAALMMVLAAPARARAGVPDATSIAVAAGYALPVGCSAVTGTYHVAYMLYDEGAPRRWRTAAYVCGGLSLAIGTYVLAGSDVTGGVHIAEGVVPLALGSYAILAAWFVGAPDDIVGPMARAPRVTPWFGAGAAGLAWTGSF